MSDELKKLIRASRDLQLAFFEFNKIDTEQLDPITLRKYQKMQYETLAYFPKAIEEFMQSLVDDL